MRHDAWLPALIESYMNGEKLEEKELEELDEAIKETEVIGKKYMEKGIMTIVNNLPIAKVSSKVLSELMVGIDTAIKAANKKTKEPWTREDVFILLRSFDIKKHVDSMR